MIRIGILSGDTSGTESIKLIQQFEDFKITGIAQDSEGQDIDDQQYTIEDLLVNSDAAYINSNRPNFELIRTGIKKSNHLFLKTLPILSLSEIKLLINLADEAGSDILLFNPYLFVAENFKIYEHIKKPNFINVRLPISKTNFKNQLLELLLFLVVMEKVELKKTDVFALEGSHKSSMINIRLVFSTGSVAQIHLGEMFRPSQSQFEIFQPDEKYISLQTPQIGSKETLSIEQNALKFFIETIEKKPTISICLNELEQAIFIFEEIREKLRYSGNLVMD